MNKQWYVKTWMPEGSRRCTFEQAVVMANSKAEARAVALRGSLVAAGRNISVRRATEADLNNQRGAPWLKIPPPSELICRWH